MNVSDIWMAGLSGILQTKYIRLFVTGVSQVDVYGVLNTERGVMFYKTVSVPSNSWDLTVDKKARQWK